MTTATGPMLSLGHRSGPFPFETLRQKLAGLDDETMASVLGVNRSTIFRWRQSERGLCADLADTLATRAGWHPCEVWADWWAWCEVEEEA